MKKSNSALYIFALFLFSLTLNAAGCSSMFGDDAKSPVLPGDTQELIMKAESGCPCSLPENETDARYVLSDTEQTALSEYKAVLEEKLLDSRESRLQQALQYQDLYLKARSESDKPAEKYMLATLDKMSENISGISLDGLNEMRNVLTTNIDEVNAIVTQFKADLDPVFYAFTEAELKILIQARKLVIDEITSRH